MLFCDHLSPRQSQKSCIGMETIKNHFYVNSTGLCCQDENILDRGKGREYKYQSHMNRDIRMFVKYDTFEERGIYETNDSALCVA